MRPTLWLLLLVGCICSFAQPLPRVQGRHLAEAIEPAGRSLLQTEDLPTASAGEITQAATNATTDEKQMVCDFVEKNKGWPGWIFCICLLCFGLVFLFLGWRMFQLLMFVIGFAMASMLSFFVMAAIFEQTSASADVAFWVSLVVGICVGIGTGALFVSCVKCWFVFGGALLGFTLGILFNSLCAMHISNYPTSWAPILWVVGCVIIFAAVGYCLGKLYIMASMAVYGASSVMYAVSGFFVMGGSTASSLCHDNEYAWAYYVAIVVLAIIGFVVQYKLFNNYEHEKYQAVNQNASV